MAGKGHDGTKDAVIVTGNGIGDRLGTIEEIAALTGVRPGSIKASADHPSRTRRDGWSFRWGDVGRTAARRAVASRRKGAAFEREIVAMLKDIGYDGACRAAAESRRLDDAGVDIADTKGELDVAIQAKHYARFPNYFDLRDKCGDDRDFVLAWKQASTDGHRGRGAVAVMDLGFFMRLLKIHHDAICNIEGDQAQPG